MLLSECDNFHRLIASELYQCTECNRYDLCGKCFTLNEGTKDIDSICSEHKFTKRNVVFYNCSIRPQLLS